MEAFSRLRAPFPNESSLSQVDIKLRGTLFTSLRSLVVVVRVQIINQKVAKRVSSQSLRKHEEAEEEKRIFKRSHS